MDRVYNIKRSYNKRNAIKRKIIFCVFSFLAFFLGILIGTKIPSKVKEIYKNASSFFTQDFKYDIIKLDTNPNYDGIGQEKVDNQDGYYTTFTTIDENKKIYKEYKQNGDASWSNNEYWDGTMADNGCGITAISIILSGYGKLYTPEYLRQKYFPVMDYNNMQEEFKSSFGIQASSFYYDAQSLSKENIKKHLESNRPILICVWTKPTANRWTSASHYMVLLATDDDDLVYISNPAGGINDYKSSGWYEYEEIIPYIASAVFIESYN